MNNDPLITVVIPVYNADFYLACCLNSLLAQTYSFFEIIVIDDGSTDSSASLIDDYLVRDKRIRAFHQHNSGVSVSRNRAISEAKGNYLTFVDADDQVGKDYLLNLVRSLPEKGGRGVVIGGMVKISPDESRMIVEVPDREYRHGDFGKLFTEITLHQSGYAASKLYNISLIREKQLYFEEKLSYGEDALFLLNYLRFADYVRFCSVTDYYYILHSGVSLSRSNRSFDAEYTVYRKMTKYLDELKQRYPEILESTLQMNHEISIYLIRSLPALYRPPYQLKFKKRLKALKGLTKEDLNLLEKNFFPGRILDKIGKMVLLNRYFLLYDIYMSIIFFIRYRILSK